MCDAEEAVVVLGDGAVGSTEGPVGLTEFGMSTSVSFPLGLSFLRAESSALAIKPPPPLVAIFRSGHWGLMLAWAGCNFGEVPAPLCAPVSSGVGWHVVT